MSVHWKKHHLFIFILLVVAALVTAACAAPPPAAITTPAEPAATEPPATETPQPEAPSEEATEPAASAPAAIDLGSKPVPSETGERPLADLTLQQRIDLFQEAPDQVIDPDAIYVATFQTDKGDIVAELYTKDAPTAVNNFVVLAELGYFDGLPWVPVPQSAVVLSGDPLGSGESDVGYAVPAEFGIPHLAGALGWLRLPDQMNPEQVSSGSQFYITLAPMPQLDGVLSVFGQVIEGQEIAEQLSPEDAIQQVLISQAEVSQAPTPPPPTPTPEPLAPAPDPDGGRPLAELPPEERDGYFNTPPAMQLEDGVDYLARITTEKGDILVDLFEEQTPNTVNNFVVLANLGFYDNTTFHRVIEGFMAQAGDPSGTGRGGPGYRFEDEFVPELTHDSAGILSMANAGPNTNGSQFFITFDATSWLDGQHTIFGKVIEGEDVLASMRLRDPATDTEPGDLIESITIETR